MSLNNVTFVKTIAALPASAPTDNAHIINEGVAGNSTANIQDAIVTLLYKISPDTLTTFSMPNIKDSRLIQKRKTGQDELVIMRRAGMVVESTLVGIAAEVLSKKILEFGHLVRLDMETDGSWKVTYTSYRDYFHYSWNDVWVGKTLDHGSSILNMKAYAGNDSIPENNKRLELFPAQLTRLILNDRMWYPVRFTSSLVNA